MLNDTEEKGGSEESTRAAMAMRKAAVMANAVSEAGLELGGQFDELKIAQNATTFRLGEVGEDVDVEKIMEDIDAVDGKFRKQREDMDTQNDRMIMLEEAIEEAEAAIETFDSYLEARFDRYFVAQAEYAAKLDNLSVSTLR